MIAESNKSPVNQVFTSVIKLARDYGSISVRTVAPDEHMTVVLRYRSEVGHGEVSDLMVGLEQSVQDFVKETEALAESLDSLCLVLADGASGGEAYDALSATVESLRGMEQDFRSQLESGVLTAYAKQAYQSAGVVKSLARARSSAATAVMLAKQKCHVPTTFQGEVSGEAYRCLADEMTKALARHA